MITSILSKLSAQSVEQDYESILPLVPYIPTAEIPKHFYRAFITQKEGVALPDIAHQTERELRALNPEYELSTVGNDFVESFIKEHYGEVIWQYFCRIDPSYGACRADLFRYLLLYRVGGVWIDLKVSMRKPLREVLKPSDKLILSHWDNLPGEEHEGWGHLGGLEHIERGEYIMGFIPVVAGHPLLRAMIIHILRNIDDYNPHIHNVGFAATMWTSGPLPYTLVAMEMQAKGTLNQERGDYREISYAHDLGFVYNYNVLKLSGVSDYRKSVRPLVRHPKAYVQAINVAYFKLLGYYRRHILKK